MPSLERDGYVITELVLTASACDTVARELPSAEGRRGGVRNVLTAPVVQRLLGDPRFIGEIGRFVDLPLVAVKATLFDKTPQSNWRVQWHQDRVIAVHERIDVAGFDHWSVKDGVPHVEPPASILERMVAVRIHLDDSGADNGPLRVIPGSHRQGKLGEDQIRDLVAARPQVGLTVPQGSILLMRPLLLHASSQALHAGHRRVLHVELAPDGLAMPLRWHTATPVRR
ncbi:MAG TPA: phytanoyl-CoA dioxygenase family protein [Thermoanaerobaculia bacterium]